MSQTESQDKLGSQLDDLGKEIQSQRPNTRGVNMDFQKLHKLGRNVEIIQLKGQVSLRVQLKHPV